MARIRLLVDLPDGPWIADVSRELPDAVFRVLTAAPDGDAGVALVRVVGAVGDEVVTAAGTHPSVTDVSVAVRDDEGVTVQVEAETPLSLLAAERAEVPVEMPVEVTDGVATLDATGSHEQLSAFGSRLDEIGLAYDVEFVRQRPTPSRLLTDTQLELLLTAVEAGYYDVPRESTLTEVAERAGVAKSTCSETLQRAERAVITEFVRELPRVADDVGAESV